jgi:hypothetical protein
MKDIVDIVQGKETQVFRRNVAELVDASQCFSIQTKKRTLDIKAHSKEEFEILFTGLELLLAEAKGNQKCNLNLGN